MPLIPDDQLDLITNSIVDKKCILFLGPKFAMAQDKGKIHLSLRAQLTAKYSLDPEYDNLYIFNGVTKKPGHKAIIISRLKNDLAGYYSGAAPHDIYEQISKIDFRAVISCTHDHFLPDSFQKTWRRDPNFEYFSQKGQQVSQVKNEDISLPEGPAFFNVFGSIKDKESLIVTYDSFYKFLMKLIGDKEKIPIQIQTSLKESSMLLLFGFDLKKWYMPLFFRRLNEYVQEGRDASSNPIVVYVNTDDTNTITAGSAEAERILQVATDADEEYYANHLALHIETLNCDTAAFFGLLSETKQAKLDLEDLQFYHKDISKASGEERAKLCKGLEIAHDSLSRDFAYAIDQLLIIYKPYETEYNEALNFKGMYSDINRNYTIDGDLDRKDIQTNKLRNMISEHCTEKKRLINCNNTTYQPL